MEMDSSSHNLTGLQKASASVMSILVIITFLLTNIQAVIWQSSQWLVSTVLPAVVVDLTNKERGEFSEKPLVRNATLDVAAKLKAEDMAKNEYFAHYSPTDVSPWHWFDEAGYVYAYAGENLAIHFTDSTEVVDAWMNSPSHRSNIVNGLYTEIGVGTAKGKFDGYDTVYVVQLFGTPAVTPAVTSTETLVEAVPVEDEVENEFEVINQIESGTSSLYSPQNVVLAETLVATSSNEEILDLNATEVSESEVLLSQDSVADESETNLSAKTVVLPNEIESGLEIAPDVVNNPDSSNVAAKEEILVLNLPALATSSGLAVASITNPQQNHAGVTLASLATQPNVLLQNTYMLLASLVVLMLSVSTVLEVRRVHYLQVAYSLMLLVGMGALWYIHSLLTLGAVVV